MARGNRKRRDSMIYGSAYPEMKNNQATIAHDSMFRLMRRILEEISLSRFTWTGIDKLGIDERFLELRLLHDGRAIFYYDTDFNRYVVGRPVAVGQPNVYDNPTSFMINRPAMRPIFLKGEDCVPIYPNRRREPEMDIINIYANKLAHIDRTIDINLMHQRHPFILAAEESTRLSIVNAFENIIDGEFAVAGMQGLDLNNAVQAFNTGIHPDTVLNTILAKQKMWNECMTLLGVNNANQDKKERLVAAEVSANDSQVESARGIGLTSRVAACDLIKQKFGLDIRCEWGPVPATVSLGEPADQPAIPTEGETAQINGIGGAL